MSSRVYTDLSLLLVDLLASDDRHKAARNLAAVLGADDLIIFIPDPDLELLLPAVGFPQTLPGGRVWKTFLSTCTNIKSASDQLPSPYTGEMVSVVTVSGTTGVVLALLGGQPIDSLMRDLVNPLSLAGQALEKERQLQLINAQLLQISSEVKSARVLTTVLDQLRRELETALESAGRETAIAEAAKKDVLKANEELAVARDQALAASHSKGAFLANMSHELRTPLTAIIGYSEMLQDEITEARTIQDLQHINDAGQHLLALVNDILDMAKIEAGHVELHAEAFEAEVVINEAVQIVAPQMAAGGNSCEVIIGPDIPPLFTDHNKLRQILLNLLSNAAKFTKNGTVTFTTSYDKATDLICFSIVDTGIGMSAEAMPRLFKEFSQLDDSSTKTAPGTGLGLAITKRLCELFGGQITVESKLGEGSTFRVEIPPRLPSEQKQGQHKK